MKKYPEIMKTYPQIGDKLYLRQYTKNYMVDMVKRPYTVVEVTPTKVLVQACKLIYPIFKANPNWNERQKEYYKDMVGKRVAFYDTVAESIEPDPTGRIEELTWHSHRGMWGTKGRDSDYPEYAVFGEYMHQPYLD